MTIEEIKDTLQTWIRTADDEYDREEIGRVCGLKSVLRLIEKLGVSDTNAGDLISKDAVLDLVADYDLSMGEVVRGIHDLPSITPQQKKCGDCISRQAAKSKAVYSHERHEKVVPVAELDWLPSAETERKTGKWIPIRIKSPQNGQRIFISTIKGTIHDVIWNTDCIHNYARNCCWYRNWFVVAWMPFTLKPYKMEVDG